LLGLTKRSPASLTCVAQGFRRDHDSSGDAKWTRTAARGEVKISAARAGLIRLLADETVHPSNWSHEIGATG
jgi:hypothetical protein